VAKTKKLFGALTRRGPHRVLRGDLGFAGLPGTVYTPESGLNLPGVAFGHDWLQGVGRYNGTLEHLASWGIVAAAPNTETGIAPSVLNLAFDLGTTLDIITGVRLGPGKISVHPTKLGLVGHGFGASAAVFTAAGLGSSTNPLKAVAAVFPTASKPDADQPAAGLRVPGLILNAPGAELTIHSNATELAAAWQTATVRTVAKAEPGGLAEGFRLSKLVGMPGADRRTQKTVRALLTGYLLFQLTGDKTYKDFADADVVLPKTVAADPDAETPGLEDKVAALLKG
jgi:dienelactone hydrolase